MSEWLKMLSEPAAPTVRNLDFSDQAVACLMPIALICGLCLLATAIWALTVVRYTTSHHKPA
jgi:hypothetical protein